MTNTTPLPTSTTLPTSVTTPVIVTTNDDDSVRLVVFSEMRERGGDLQKGERIVGVVPVVRMVPPPRGDNRQWENDNRQWENVALPDIPLADSAFVVARSGLAKRLAESEAEALNAWRSEARLHKSAAEAIVSQDKKISELEAKVAEFYKQRFDEQERRQEKEQHMGRVRNRLKALEQQLGVQKIRELEADGVIEKL